MLQIRTHTQNGNGWLVHLLALRLQWRIPLASNVQWIWWLIIMSYHARSWWFQVMIRKISLVWRRLVSSPASHNELHSLELPRTWEPTCNSRACGFGAGKSSLSRVLSRNMGRWSKAKLCSDSHSVWSEIFCWKN